MSSFLKSNQFWHSDTTGVGYGRIRRRFLWQEGLPHARYQTLPKSGVGREDHLPSTAIRESFQDGERWTVEWRENDRGMVDRLLSKMIQVTRGEK